MTLFKLDDCAQKGIRPKSNSRKTLGTKRRTFIAPLKKDEHSKKDEPHDEEPPAPPPTKKYPQTHIKP